MNFEAFCGNDKPVEGRGSRVEGRGSSKNLPRRGAILLRAMRLRRDKVVAGGG